MNSQFSQQQTKFSPGLLKTQKRAFDPEYQNNNMIQNTNKQNTKIASDLICCCQMEEGEVGGAEEKVGGPAGKQHPPWKKYD